jgi:hypothetical protein
MSKIRTEFQTSFDELMKNRYGRTSPGILRDLTQVDALIANYYGKPAARRRRGKKPEQPARVLSLSVDDGETLLQVPPGTQFEEYVVQSSIAEAMFEEYVVPGVAFSWQSSYEETAAAEPAEDSAPFQEYLVDVRQPLEQAPDQDRGQAPAPAPSPTAPSSPAPAPDQGDGRQGQAPGEPISATGADSRPAQATEDDFLADIKSILSGQKLYDPDKGMVAKEPPSASQPVSDQQVRPELPAPDAENSQAIFDRIAQSMQYANAYDLGTVELENRFSEFDRVHDMQQKASERKKTPKPATPAAGPAPAPTVGSKDFIEDLDSIRQQYDAGSAPQEMAAAESNEYSRPFYDTGEHVQTGGDLYADHLRVGKSPGVLFSYGQIIAMADLFETVDQMMAADVGDLKRTKALIERSTAYYESNKAGSVRDVSSEEWEQATGGRYLKLAENNYEHFSPNFLFKDEAIARAANRHGDNKSAWEHYHRRAIEEAQKMFIAQGGSNTSLFLEWPLIINAFGDHFLTDAFAAGHLINKEVMIRLFKSNFYNGTSLKPEGEAFFKKVASAAFKGPVKKKFSALETSDYPVCAWGWCFKWHPNINSPDRFSKVLIGAAEQEPDRIANFAVKAMHDRLNHDGIEVSNQAGDGRWQLTGDTTLNAKNLGIIHKAVQQSVDNINDPSIFAGNLDFAAYFAKVWKHVPQPTDASLRRLENLMREYTRPDSDALVTAAADIIYKEVDALIKALLDAKKLKPA